METNTSASHRRRALPLSEILSVCKNSNGVFVVGGSGGVHQRQAPARLLGADGTQAFSQFRMFLPKVTLFKISLNNKRPDAVMNLKNNVLRLPV